MAACTRWKVFFPVLILCVSLLGMAVSVRGDAALIQDVCSKTSRPFYCKTCYELNRKSSQDQNVKDLGRTSIGCASLEFEIFRSTLRSLMINPKNLGPGLQDACNHCISLLEDVDKKLQNALLKWQHASYDSSSLQMFIAANILDDSCGREMKKFNLPMSLADKLVALDGFIQASIGVLDQIQ
ncbi:hypothetical protein F2P56_033527 [Juglans regia]|nr:uncharacterized protein LOC109003468 [Juglans regia]XP_035540922.1 uncharacterized protein LOC109003362 [Juglans regia]XP_035541194.1 uncharacterized protein LOC109003468 [Juglans regia]XP_035541195.1 uncharacterized protein LOC109003468 [Juglans regia]XP_035541196.1 uncharacterized protein LOC109003468 [Juglans regia]XP_035541441.1 uncharacterized protein LOC118344551 [Juglans regia]KAF5448015.1 hypothetical protein F2P56_033522 [Juglans regia]KAF5448016.1 hypothetical protein F2P56_0335